MKNIPIELEDLYFLMEFDVFFYVKDFLNPKRLVFCLLFVGNPLLEA